MLTPLDRDGGVDHSRFAAHAQRLLARGIDGVTPFGTTGEGQSFSLGERAAGLSALLAAGIPSDRIIAATGCAALTETIALTRQGAQSGCAACLVLPPFFFRDVSEDGLFAWYARVIEAVAHPGLRMLLYHIPQVTGVSHSVNGKSLEHAVLVVVEDCFAGNRLETVFTGNFRACEAWIAEYGMPFSEFVIDIGA